MRWITPIFAAVTLLPATISAQVLGQGQIVPRPAQGAQPTIPPPTIVDYKPRSTLVVPVHMVPRAKFPVVDFHGHPPVLSNSATINTVARAMDTLNVQVMVQANGVSGNALKQQLDAIKASPDKDRFVVFTEVKLDSIRPGSGAKIAAQLEADIKAGASGLGEIMKGFGMTIKKADGTRLKLDDPELDAVWEMAGKLKIPVFIHVGDPEEFFAPLDMNNERWLEQALYPNRRYQDTTKYPRFEALMAERDRLFARHPNTIWVVAHMGWHAQDLARLGKMFDANPNLYTEMGAVLYDIGRQPRAAHDFFVKYQDRILFGKDSFQPDEYPYYWRVLETNDEYFDYYRNYHAFWKLYGIGLPDSVLAKVYYKNALKLVPNIPRGAFPK